MKKLFSQASLLLFGIGLFTACTGSTSDIKSPTPEQPVAENEITDAVLVFSKTDGYYHTSIPAGQAALQKLGMENNFLVDTTKNAAYFTADSLQKYSAVIFLNTTKDVLDEQQQAAFQEYIRGGGGFVGIHAATDTEYDWPWFNQLVGAYFANHPEQQEARVLVKDKTHPSTTMLPDTLVRFDEWYNFKDIQPNIKVLAYLDETSYKGGTNGDNHPIAWHQEFEGGRVFYTAGGHTNESYSEPLFLQHILGGIRYAMGKK
jgi:type 1 glutamine amidotransferase